MSFLVDLLLGRSKQWKLEEEQRRHKQMEAERLNNPSTRYTQLQAYLEAKQFADADEETYRIMLSVIGSSEKISKEAMLAFPCDDLCQIDHFWMQSSQGRFGFSAQKKIWDAGGKPRIQDIPPMIDFGMFGWGYVHQQFGITVSSDMDFERLSPGFLPFRCLIWIDCYRYGPPKMAMVGTPSQGWFMKDLQDRLNDGLVLLMQRLNACICKPSP